MKKPKPKPKITHVSLFRKYGGKIMTASSLELRAAAASLSKGKNCLQALFEAAREYDRQIKAEAEILA